MLRRQVVQDVVLPAFHKHLISISASLFLVSLFFRMPIGTCVANGAECGTCSCSM